MAENPDEIKRHIDSERGALSANLNELEYRVKAATDRRAQFREHTMAALGVAFGAGLIIALATAGSDHR